jgi:hypothetical protein
MLLYIQGRIRSGRQESRRSYESRETIRVRWYIQVVSEDSHHRFVGAVDVFHIKHKHART